MMPETTTTKMGLCFGEKPLTITETPMRTSTINRPLLGLG